MSVEETLDRYSRQELISGWDQGKLEGSKIAIVGGGMLGQMLGLTMSALGFGSLEIYGVGESIFGNAKEAAAFYTRVNPLVTAKGYGLDVWKSPALLGIHDLIIDASNNPAAKLALADYAIANHIHFLSASSGKGESRMGMLSKSRVSRRMLENILFTTLENEEQGALPSMLMAGVVAEEARKCVMPIPNDDTLEDIIIYNLMSKKRFDSSKDEDEVKFDAFKDKRVLMVGAGALGTFAGLGLALYGIRELDIADGDTVESTNLNRQVLYYESIGERKAAALAEKLTRFAPNSRIVPLVEYITPESEQKIARRKYDLIIETVDNNKARALINYFARKYRIPLISGGTSFSAGQTVVYKPGETSCLNCQADIDKLAAASHRPASCIYAPEPSVVISNQIIGASIVGEALSLFSRKAVNGIIKYVSQESYRLGMLPTSPACDCHKDAGGWMEKMGYLYAGEPHG